MIGLAARVTGQLQAEVTQLRAENARLRAQLAAWTPVGEGLPEESLSRRDVQPVEIRGLGYRRFGWWWMIDDSVVAWRPIVGEGGGDEPE